MSKYYINPTKIINNSNFNHIMDNLTNDISNIFITNKNLVNNDNYKETISLIFNVLNEYFKIYKFAVYDVEKIYVQIYNSDIEVIINIKVTIATTYFIFFSNNWSQFYLNLIKTPPVLYNYLTNDQKNELNASIINGNFYFNNIDIEFTRGIILKKKSCSCDTNNCNINYSYVITVWWE